MNNTFVRRTDLDTAFENMHGVKPMVSLNRKNQNEYTVKLIRAGKEANITEYMTNGLTSYVELKLGADISKCKSVYEAETIAADYLRG